MPSVFENTYIAGLLEKVDISSFVYSWQQQPARAKHRNMQENYLAAAAAAVASVAL